MSRFRLTLDSDLSDVFAVSAMVRGVCEHLAMDATRAYSVELCAVEAVTNSIRHAYGGAPGREVTLDVYFDHERLSLGILDSGVPMPQENIDQLVNGSGVFDFDPNNLDGLPEGGMGLEIMRQRMDEVVYSIGHEHNCLLLTIFLQPETEIKK